MFKEVIIIKFECIKTLEFPCYKEDNSYRYPFIKGKVYDSWIVTRTRLCLINESGNKHDMGDHWLHWKYGKFYKEYFVRIK